MAVVIFFGVPRDRSLGPTSRPIARPPGSEIENSHGVEAGFAQGLGGCEGGWGGPSESRLVVLLGQVCVQSDLERGVLETRLALVLAPLCLCSYLGKRFHRPPLHLSVEQGACAGVAEHREELGLLLWEVDPAATDLAWAWLERSIRPSWDAPAHSRTRHLTGRITYSAWSYSYPSRSREPVLLAQRAQACFEAVRALAGQAH